MRGEISTYSDKMLQLYAEYVVEKASKGENIARLTINSFIRMCSVLHYIAINRLHELKE